MSSCTNRELRNDLYIAARRDRRSRDCFDARVIAPKFRRSCYGSIGDRTSASPPPPAERLSQNAMDSHIHIWRQLSESFRSGPSRGSSPLPCEGRSDASGESAHTASCTISAGGTD